MAMNPDMVRAIVEAGRTSAEVAEGLIPCAEEFVVSNMAQLRRMVGIIGVGVEGAGALAASAFEASEAAAVSAKTAATAAAEAAAAMEEADSKRESDRRSAQISLAKAVAVAAESARAAAETVRVLRSVAATIEELFDKLPAAPNHEPSLRLLVAGTTAALIALAGNAEGIASDFAKYVREISENITPAPQVPEASSSARTSAPDDEDLPAEADKRSG